jgi:hypothetical protein
MRTLPLIDDDIAPMIRGHEITLELARTQGLTQLLNDLHTSTDLRAQMKTDPYSYLQSRGVSFPSNASVTVRELEADGWEIEIKIVEGLYSYINGFNNEKGFYRIQGPQRPTRTSGS